MELNKIQLGSGGIKIKNGGVLDFSISEKNSSTINLINPPSYNNNKKMKKIIYTVFAIILSHVQHLKVMRS